MPFFSLTAVTGREGKGHLFIEHNSYPKRQEESTGRKHTRKQTVESTLSKNNKLAKTQRNFIKSNWKQASQVFAV